MSNKVTSIHLHLRLDENVHGRGLVRGLPDANHSHPGRGGASHAPARAVSGPRLRYPVQLPLRLLLDVLHVGRGLDNIQITRR